VIVRDGDDVAAERADAVFGLELHRDASQPRGAELHLVDLVDERGVMLVEARSVDDEFADDFQHVAQPLVRDAHDLSAGGASIGLAPIGATAAFGDRRGRRRWWNRPSSCRRRRLRDDR
jgi:hypothetical protein